MSEKKENQITVLIDPSGHCGKCGKKIDASVKACGSKNWDLLCFECFLDELRSYV